MLSLASFGAFAPTVGCGPSIEARSPRPPLAEDWYTRAQASYAAGDFEDASEAAKQALKLVPNDIDVRLIGAKVALTRLDYDTALKLTEGLETTDAHSVRGRARWYSGDVEQAADELESMLQDPKVKDPWAREVAHLARRGQGRHPFAMEGGLVAAVDMPRAIASTPIFPAHVVPCELGGERILALIATGTSEVVVDSNSRREPAWVNLRFADSIEVKDVPALTQDLAPLSRQLGVPIKALLGVNLLRHIHATFDRRGDQFVVRRNEASAPPDASRVPVWYVRGGGMTVRANFTAKEDGEAPLLVDSGRSIAGVVLTDTVWKKAGVDLKTLSVVADAPGVRRGVVPTFLLGGFDLSKIPAFEGVDTGEAMRNSDVHVGGLLGSEILALFRVTFADEGRFIWIEADPTLIAPPPTQRPMPPPLPPGATPPPPPPADIPPPKGGAPGLKPPGSAAPKATVPGPTPAPAPATTSKPTAAGKVP
jgi:hypothetical protein